MTKITKEQVLEAQVQRDELSQLQIEVETLEAKGQETYTGMVRSEKVVFTRGLTKIKARVEAIQEALKTSPPAPLSPETATMFLLTSLQKEVDEYEVHKLDFLKAIEANPAHAIQWAESLVKEQYSAGIAQHLVELIEKSEGSGVEKWGILVTTLRRIRDTLIEDQISFDGMTSSSPFSNAVALAQGRARTSLLRGGWLTWAMASMRNFRRQVDVWTILQE